MSSHRKNDLTPRRAAPCTGHPPRRWLAGLVAVAALAWTATAAAAISSTERQVLVDLYASANGAAWIDHTGWNGPVGTECSWIRLTCDPSQTHVIAIDLVNNNLSGTLPPSLASLTALQIFSVDKNALTGSIPSLAGLTSLQYAFFSHNQFSGSIPPLNDLSALQLFYAHVNSLSGPIPALSRLTELRTFGVNNNQLTGSIPALSGLTSLYEFYAGQNQLTGPIPLLTGLSSLTYFYVDDNHLSGSIPSLAGLTSLGEFYVSNNQLTGMVPMPPSNLEVGSSALCPNLLDAIPSNNDAGWDAATGYTPWWAVPHASNQCDGIFTDGFDG